MLLKSKAQGRSSLHADDRFYLEVGAGGREGGREGGWQGWGFKA
jgi:hypothetical protein